MKAVKFLVLMLMPCFVFAQQPKLQEHIVQSGETAYGIARSYGMTVDDFYDINPEARELLKDGVRVMVFIPSDNVPVDSARYYFHTVKPGETVYRLTRQYDITESILFESNPGLSESGLRVDDVIRIPKAPRRAPITEELATDDKSDETGFLIHDVQPGETVYSLTKKYEISANELVNRNPILSEGLKVGQRLKIRPETSKPHDPRLSMTSTTDSTRQPFTLYRIAEGDGLTDILKLFDVTYEELERYNPRLQEGLRTGRMLLVPLRPTKDQTVKRDTSLYSLDRVYPKGKVMRIALFLPLDMERDDEGARAYKDWVKGNDVSLSFYAGVKLALDSLYSFGIRVDAWVYDDKQITKDVVRAMDSMDLIIGPVFHRELSNLQNAMNKERIRVPIVSPMSREKNILEIPNVYHCLPTTEGEIEAMAAFINRHYAGHPVVMVHENASSYASKSDAFIQWVNDTILQIHKGGVERNQLEALLNAENDSLQIIVVLFGKSKTFVASTINNLAALRSNNMVLISESGLIKIPTVEFEKLGRLNFIRPENNYINTSHHGTADFLRAYRRLYNREANRYAMQGFDVTWYFVGKIWGSDHIHNPIQQHFRFEQTPAGSFENKERVWIGLDSNLDQRTIQPRP